MSIKPSSSRGTNRASTRRGGPIHFPQVASTFALSGRQFVLLLTLLIAPGSLCGCLGTKAPAVTMLESRFVERTDDASLVTIDLDFQNFENDPISLVDIFYVIEVNGRRVNTSRLAAQATIPQLGVQQVRVPAVIPHDALGGVPTGVQVVAVSGRVTYVPPGAFTEALFDIGARVPSVRFIAATDIEFGVDPGVPSDSLTPPVTGAPLPTPESRPDPADAPN